MKSLIFISVIGALLSSASVSAEVVTKKLSFGTKVKLDAKNPMATQKANELDRRWAECAKLSVANSIKNPELRGWILLSGFRCSRRVWEENKTLAALQAVLKEFDKNRNLLVTGPWRAGLLDEFESAHLILMENLPKANTAGIWKSINTLYEFFDSLTPEQKARVHLMSGIINQGQSNLKAARFYYESSLEIRESKEARDRLSATLLALNTETKTKVEKPSQDLTAANEIRLEERIKAANNAVDPLPLLEDLVSYLNEFPSGRRSKQALDRIQEITRQLFEKSSDPRFMSIRDRLLSLTERLEPLRLGEVAKGMHRRADFEGALRLSESALSSLEKTREGSALMFIAGRSAQMLGQYSKANQWFDKFIETSSGSEDLAEVYFRQGLVSLRQKEYSSSIALFEKLLLLKGNDKYALSARYWLVRALQKSENSRASAEAKALADEYPTSYYGLRLRAEMNANVLTWPTSLQMPTPLKGEVFLSAQHEKVLKRATALASQNWIYEAQTEILSIPGPTEPVQKVLWADHIAQMQVLYPVLPLLNEASDLDPSLRSLDIVSLSYPKAFGDTLDNEARANLISPVLMRSLIRQESAYSLKAISTSSAFGVMQLIQPTALEMTQSLGLKDISLPEDLYSPAINIKLGVGYYAKMLKQFSGSVPFALAAYNAGPARMQLFVKARADLLTQMKSPGTEALDELWFDELPWFETSFYVKAILRNALIYRLIDVSREPKADDRRLKLAPVLWSDLVLSQ